MKQPISTDKEIVDFNKPSQTVENTSNSRQDSQSKTDQSIRKFDFDNFQYQWCDELHYLRSKIFRLEDGEKVFSKTDGNNRSWSAKLYLANIFYKDLTDDGKEDAIVTVNGTEYPGQRYGCTYIFTDNDNKIKEIWSYAHGEKWQDGLRTINIERSEIVLELYTFVPGTENGLFLNNGNEIERANFYKRLKFKWNGSKFTKVNKELIANPDFSFNFLGYFLNGNKVED